MSAFKKWALCGKTESPDSPETDDEGVPLQAAVTDHFIIVPKYWIDYDDKARMVALRIQLPGCSKDMIKVLIWNTTHVLVRAMSSSRLYKLEYELPRGARLLRKKWFAAEEEVLTCRFLASNPQCIVCEGSISSNPFIESKELIANVPVLERAAVLAAYQGIQARGPSKGVRYELLKPQFWITYDEKKKALLEVHLRGCKSPSQINLCIDNNKVLIQAHSSAHQLFKLEVRLNSSAKPGWNTNFDEQFEMFTCTIPLLGYFECYTCCTMRGANKEMHEETFTRAVAAPPTSPCQLKLDEQHNRIKQVRKGPLKGTPSKSTTGFEDSSDSVFVPAADGSDTAEILPTDEISIVD